MFIKWIKESNCDYKGDKLKNHKAQKIYTGSKEHGYGKSSHADTLLR